MKMLEQYPQMMSGENIELLNRLLAQHTERSSRRSEFQELEPTYRSLGMMLINGLTLSEDMSKVLSLKKGKSHFTFEEDDPRIDVAVQFFNRMLDDMESEVWRHYRYPRKKVSRPRGRPPSTSPHKRQRGSVEDSEDKEPEEVDVVEEELEQPDTPLEEIKRSGKAPGKTKTKLEEDLTSELIDVHPLEDLDWLEQLKRWEKSLWTLEGKWKLNLSADVLSKIPTEFSDFSRG